MATGIELAAEQIIVLDHLWFGLDSPLRVRVEPFGVDGEPLPVEPRVTRFLGFGVIHEVGWERFGMRAECPGAFCWIDGEDEPYRCGTTRDEPVKLLEDDSFWLRFRLAEHE